MKKELRLTLLLALAIMMVMPSCKKADKQIVGKWKITYAKEDGYSDKKAVGENWTFKENGTFNGYLVDWGDVTAKWSIDGDELIIKGGDLEESTEEQIYTLDIDQLDKSNLVVSGKVKYIDTWYDETETWSASYELEAK